MPQRVPATRVRREGVEGRVTVRPVWRICSMLALGCSVGAVGLGHPGAAARLQTAPARSARVSLGSGASLEQALAALRDGSGGAVVCDAPQIDRHLTEPIEAATLVDATQQIARSFDFWPIQRGRGVAFHRRYSDLREEAGLETEEISPSAADLYRL